MESGAKKIIFCTDIVHIAKIQMANPEIAVTLDVDPDAAVMRREEFLTAATIKGFWLAQIIFRFPELVMLPHWKGILMDFCKLASFSDNPAIWNALLFNES